MLARRRKTRWLRGLVGAAVLGGGLSGLALARDLWVDPRGLGGACDDAGEGDSSARPLCTLSACLSRATAGGDHCWLRAGRYAGNAVPGANGQPGLPITVARYGEELVEIWGTVPLAGTWRSETDGVFTIPTDRPRPLALVETTPGGATITYAAWTVSAKRRPRADAIAPGTFVWEPGNPSTIRLRRPAGSGDPNASSWRARSPSRGSSSWT